MRVTFLGNFGVDYSSETHHKKSLESLGHEVIALQETQASSQLVLQEAYKSDMFVWVHTHGWQTPGTIPMRRVLQRLKAKNIPTVTYHLDLWLGLQRQNDLARDPVYTDIEWFFTVDPLMADWFNKNTRVKGRYLRAGVIESEMKLEHVPYEHEIIFVGSKGYHPEWPWRPQLIDHLSQTFGTKFEHFGGDGLGVVRGGPLTELYNRSKIVIGDSLVKNFDYPGYWSDRLYETVGRGGFIIFPRIEGLETEFVIDPVHGKQELATYQFGDLEQLDASINWYLEHDDVREKIRELGFERCKQYTYKKRWETIIKEVGLDGKE